MNGDREQLLRSVLEKTAADIKILSLTADTMCMGLEREHMETQATASLKTISMGLSYIQQNICNALETEQDHDKGMNETPSFMPLFVPYRIYQHLQGLNLFRGQPRYIKYSGGSGRFYA